MLFIIEDARVELNEASRFYDNEKAGLGQEFLDAVEKALEQVEANPGFCPRLETLRTRREIRRFVLTRFPYLLVYEVISNNQVKVLAVSHDRRRPNYWKKRLEG